MLATSVKILTLIHVCTGKSVARDLVPGVTVTPEALRGQSGTKLLTSPVPLVTSRNGFTGGAVLSQHEMCRARAEKRALRVGAVMLTSSSVASALVNVYTRDVIRMQFVASAARAAVGAGLVVTVLLAAAVVKLTFVHIDAGGVVREQLKARPTVTAMAAGQVDTQLAAPPVADAAFVHVETDETVSGVAATTLAEISSVDIAALRMRVTSVISLGTLVDVHTAVILAPVALGTGTEIGPLAVSTAQHARARV